jgi:Pin2-interacting protein X1
MGLAETKRKKKLLPSNHAASTCSKAAPDSSIGFKLMASMGWAPGSGLGSDLQGEKDNVKYSLKDDLLGVGAKKEYGGGVWRGMSEVDDLYKRLDVGSNGSKQNGEAVEGKVEVLQEEVNELKLKGGWKMRFQVGDTYTSSFSREESEAEGMSGASTPAVEEVNGDAGQKKNKKRKRDEDGEKKEKEKKPKKEKSVDTEEKKSKKSKEKSKDKEAEKLNKEKKEKEKKEKKGTKDKSKTSVPVPAEPEKKKRRKSEKDPATAPSEEQADTKPTTNGVGPTSSDSKKDKKSKKDKTEKKDKSASKAAKEPKKPSKKDKKKTKSSNSTDSDTTAPISVTASVITVSETIVVPPEEDRLSPIPRHMHRSRYLAMKRAATMDKNALREILGVKG